MRTLFRGGGLFDGHRHQPGRALVVEDDLVAALVTEAEASDVAAAVDRVVDLEGGLLAPGFVDAHVHVVQGGLERIRCDLSGVSTREAYLATVADHAASRPDVEWILGGGWEMAAFPGGTPTAADLDRVVRDRPVFLPNRDHHGAWVNSRALELAGIHAGTPDPADGRIERDADGQPTGTLHEGAMGMVSRLLPPTTDEELRQGLLAGQAHLHESGVTGWQDAILGAYAGMDDPSQTYLRAARSGDLTGTVVGALWWDREAGLEQVEDLVQRRAAYTHGRLRATSVKIMQDGVAENGTAAMLTPYLDRCGHPTHNRGHSFLSAELLREAVVALHERGFQVHVHTIGDRGVREALDAIAETRRVRPDPGASGLGHVEPRHHLAHVQLVHPDDVARFAELGVSANLQMLWACLDQQMVELTIPFLGAERARWQYPFGDLDRAGARLVCGSDWPVSSPDPLAAIHVAVTRTAHGASGPEGEEPFLPDQALSLERAFAAYTSGSAWINHRDGSEPGPRAGVLAPGAVADLVVLDRDPFAGPAGDIGAVRVRSTWIDGRVVAEPLS
ncbi:amidohydrolase [Nocardioides piscis]|uniref:Amidohydrolase family protein n=1 Tax=Nocardioides piscis TaxID=2714938 RepID=A0A6G7YGH1_9ACTN|nr:amidohydrolase [Nocardioides piscis]QIK75829.1 amidohydrolase family protein [Nocardioides piscis]